MIDLSHRIKNEFERTKLTLAVAESLTCGRLQSIIGAVSGSSNYFRGGITAYSLRRKVNLLGVDAAHAEEVNCVSKQVATEMAIGACSMFEVPVAVATTGYAEPSLTDGVEAPLAHVAVCIWPEGGGKEISTELFTEKGMDRIRFQQHVAEGALALMLKCLAEVKGL